MSVTASLPPDYKNDPYSEGDPSDTICARGDLASDPMPGGCYDTKVGVVTPSGAGTCVYTVHSIVPSPQVTDYFMAGLMSSWAENGPTHQVRAVMLVECLNLP